MGEKQQHLYEFGPFRLDTTERTLSRDGAPLTLTPKAFETLVVLIERRGRLIEKGELMDALWPESMVEEANLTNNVWALRKTLGDGQNDHRYIETVPKRGYRFIADVTELPDTQGEVVVEKHSFTRIITEETEEQEAEAMGDAEPRPHTATDFSISPAPRLRIRALLALVAACMMFIGAATVLQRLGFSGGRLIPDAAAASSSPSMIAVLPFVNESGDSDSEYLSDGLSESLVNSISQLPQLKVIARSSAFKYKGRDVNLQDAARELGVQMILMGRVMRRGDALLVSVELVDARDQTQIWGEQYSRRASDIQTLPKEITRTISERLRLPLSGAQEQQLSKRATQNPRAYELYLNGLFYFRKPGIDGAKKSLDYFNQAVALDPSFALAWVEVARVNRFIAGNSLLDPKEVIFKAKAATLKALELDGSLAEAHLELAGIKQGEWDWNAAEQEYRWAIELNPNMADAHARYSNYLSMMERHTEAIAENKRAQELDPLRVELRSQEAFALFLARRYDEAIAKAQEAIDLGSNKGFSHFGLGIMYAAKGMYKEAINAYQQAAIIKGEDMTSLRCYLGYALAMSGKRRQAQAVLDQLKTTKEYVSPTELAVLYVGLGDKDGAIISLESAYAAHDIQLPTLKVDPHFDGLRTDPRFAALLRRAGLP